MAGRREHGRKQVLRSMAWPRLGSGGGGPKCPVQPGMEESQGSKVDWVASRSPPGLTTHTPCDASTGTGSAGDSPGAWLRPEPSRAAAAAARGADGMR